MGTPDKPQLLNAVRWQKWDSQTILDFIDDKLDLWPELVVYVEQTFSHGTKRKGYLRDVGRLQENQAGYLEGALRMKCEVKRCPPVSAAEAFAAWQRLGEPEAGKGPAGEHLKDSAAVSLKGMAREYDHATSKPTG
jgi:hypothetical protein